MLNTKLLIVEDDPIFTNALMWQITRMGYDRMYIQSASSVEEFTELAKEFVPEVILLDLNIVDSQGIDTYDAVISVYPNSAVIILSGMSDEELALKIVKFGAQDYLLKSDVSSKMLAKAIEYSKERKNLLGLLKVSESKYRNVFNHSPLPMFIVSGTDLIITNCNKACLNFYSYTEAEMIGKSLWFLSSSKKSYNQDFSSSFQTTDVHLNAHGEAKHVELISNPIYNDSDEYICVIVDKTSDWEVERKKYAVLSAANEKEKMRTAKEMNERLAQTLDLLSSWFGNLKIVEEQKILKEMFGRHLDNVVKETKNITQDLLPPFLEEGIFTALNMQVERINRQGQFKIDYFVHKDALDFDLSNIDQINLFRIFQEFIGNSMKHAGSNQMGITISKEDETLQFLLDDKGVDRKSVV